MCYSFSLVLSFFHTKQNKTKQNVCDHVASAFHHHHSVSVKTCVAVVCCCSGVLPTSTSYDSITASVTSHSALSVKQISKSPAARRCWRLAAYFDLRCRSHDCWEEWWLVVRDFTSKMDGPTYKDILIRLCCRFFTLPQQHSMGICCAPSMGARTDPVKVVLHIQSHVTRDQQGSSNVSHPWGKE